MARIGRIVAPGFPHHVIQRGNRKMQTFFCKQDYDQYMGMLSVSCRRFGVEIWAYCLMPNHVHLIAVPSREDALAQAIGEVHKQYSRRINFRHGWRGHLWQGRFASYVMEEKYCLAAARYIELNPVKARIVGAPSDYPYSSARAHLLGQDDPLVHIAPLLTLVSNWKEFLAAPESPEQEKFVLRHEKTGRPLGETQFVSRLETLLGKNLRKGKPGPKRCLVIGGN